MKKTVFLLIVSLSGTAHASEVAEGQAGFIFTQSRIANIINARNAETEALSTALGKIEIKCVGENFDFSDIKFSNRGMNKGSITVNASVEFTCR